MDWTTGRDSPEYIRIAAPAHARAAFYLSRPSSPEHLNKLERASSNLRDLESHNQSGPSSPEHRFRKLPSFTDYYRPGSVSPPLRRHQPDRSVSPPLRRYQPAGFNSSRPSSPEYRHKFERAPTISIIDDFSNDNLSNKPEDGMDHPAGSISPEDIITDELTNDNVTEKPEGKIDHPADSYQGPILAGDKLGDNLTDDNVSKKPEDEIDYSAGPIFPGDKLRDELTNDDVSKKPEDKIDHSAGSTLQKLHSPKPEHIVNTNDETFRPLIPPVIPNKPKEKDDMRADNLVVSAQIDELEYTRASNVNVSNFVSVKLCGKSNYYMWKNQMSCLMRSHNMLGLIDVSKNPPAMKNADLANRYKNLLNGWLIGSLNEKIIKDDRIYEKGGKELWDALEKSYDPHARSRTDSTPLEKRDKTSQTRENADNSELIKKLHTAALEGDSWKGKSTRAISDYDDTLLHVAVREGNNYFLYKLLNIIDIEQIKIKNSRGHTALHIAAIVGNKDAAELLVEKNKDLLEIEDNKSKRPLACAYLNKQVNAFVYLWKVTHDMSEVAHRSIDESPPPEKSEEDTKRDVDERLKFFGTEMFKILQDKEKKKVIGKSLQDKEKGMGKNLQEKEMVNGKSLQEKEKVNGKSLQDEEKRIGKRLQEKEIQTSLGDKEKGIGKSRQEKEKKVVNGKSPQEIEKEKREEEKKEKIIVKIGESLLHTAIFNKEYDLAKELVKINPGLAKEPLTLLFLTRNFPSQICFTETLMYPSLRNVCHKLVKRSSLLVHSFEYLNARAGGTKWEMRRFRCNYYSFFFPELVIALLVPAAILYPIYQLLCLLILLLLFPFTMLYYISWKVLAYLVVPIEKIEMKRKKHKEAKNFLKWLCNKNNSCEANSSKDFPFDIFYRESLMEAARLDVYEVLDQILELSTKVMDVKTKDGHNIIQLAVINRSQKVYNLISPIIKRKRSYRRAKDIFDNNLLNLAGKLAPLAVLSGTTGAALQLQRQLQWREEVEKLIEPTQHTDENVDYETPKMVFSREHESLVKEGEKWMKTTAESCSITAALIITIVFAAAITVPGGSNQETGIPLFKRKIAFNIFAVADAVSLFSASTSLLVFLSILTTRFAENDFLISLPRRLFIGLCLLFLSTTAMMFAFSTILFLVFCDERPWMLAPIGGLTCFPIAAIVTLQLPLVIDLYQATSIPIFGKKENEERAEEEENEEKVKVEEEKRKFPKINGVYNLLRKRRSTTCSLC